MRPWIAGTVGFVASLPAMQTPDGVWRVEVYRQPRTRDSWWYRLINVPAGNAVEDLSIATLQRLLAEAGVDMADLQDCTEVEKRHHGAA